VEHAFTRDVLVMIKEKNIRTEIAPDGNQIASMADFINALTGRKFGDKYGTNVIGKLVKDESDDKTILKNFGLYENEISVGGGKFAHATTFKGLKGLLCLNALKGVPLAQGYIQYAADVTTLYEAADPSSNIYNAMARDAVAQERAAGGASIAAEPQQVLAARMVCFCCTYADIGTTLQVPIAQGAPDVGFKRKAAEDNQIYDWQTDERAYEVQVKQWQRNNDVKTKMLAGAEAAVVKTKGVAESKVILADADVKKKVGNAEAYAIRLVADGKKTVNDAEAAKLKAQTALLQFELEQKKNAAGIGTGVNKIKSNVDVVPLAIYKRSNTTTPLTEQQKQNKLKQQRQVRLDAKAYRASLVSD